MFFISGSGSQSGGSSLKQVVTNHGAVMLNSGEETHLPPNCESHQHSHSRGLVTESKGVQIYTETLVIKCAKIFFTIRFSP